MADGNRYKYYPDNTADPNGPHCSDYRREILRQDARLNTLTVAMRQVIMLIIEEIEAHPEYQRQLANIHATGQAAQEMYRVHSAMVEVREMIRANDELMEKIDPVDTMNAADYFARVIQRNEAHGFIFRQAMRRHPEMITLILEEYLLGLHEGKHSMDAAVENAKQRMKDGNLGLAEPKNLNARGR